MSAAVNETICSVNIPGYTPHGNCNLLCKPAEWTDVLLFFLGNYVAHAATVLREPGESTVMSVIGMLLAVVFPTSGIFRGLKAIGNFAAFAPTDLQMAARA